MKSSFPGSAFKPSANFISTCSNDADAYPAIATNLVACHFSNISKKLLIGFFAILSVVQAFAWTDGELLTWISDNRGYHALGDLGKNLEQEMGVPVKVETQEEITEEFQTAAQGGKGPDIFFWAHDRIGEWAHAGLSKPVEI